MSNSNYASYIKNKKLSSELCRFISDYSLINGGSVNGDLNINGNLSVGGNSNINFVISSDLDMSCNSIIDVSGITFCDNSFIGPTNSYFNGDVSFNNNVDISGNLNIIGNITVGGSSNIPTNLVISSDLDMSNNSIIDVSGIEFFDSSFIGPTNSYFNGDVSFNSNVDIIGNITADTIILTGAVSSISAGTATSSFLRINIDGTFYKIELLSDT